MLVVDIRELLDENGNIPAEPARERCRTLRLARLVEAGAPLLIGETVDTLVECTKRPNRTPCPGLMCVAKQGSGAIYAVCATCHQDEVRIIGWLDTQWARDLDVHVDLAVKT